MPIVDVESLADQLAGTRPPRVLDVRWSLAGPPARELYVAGHLPGAVFADLDADLAAPPGRAGRHPLPDPEDLQNSLRRLGIFEASSVVAYDAGDGSIAARAWWLLRWAGYDDVAVLDGGYAAWVGSGRSAATGEQEPVPAGDVVVRPGNLPVVDAYAAAQIAQDGVLIDVRAIERYRGETEPIDRVAGHIPGAVSAPLSGNVDGQGRFLAADALRERFVSLGVDGEHDVAAYCGSGVSAAQTILALELAGLSGALYAGSWSEWVADPDRPVATGDSGSRIRRRPSS